MTQKLMIIDDEWLIRKPIYENVLNEFEYIGIESPNDLFPKIAEVDVDAYLVDIVLDKWSADSKKPQELIPVLEAISNKNDKPIFLVSSEYGTLLQNDQLTGTLNKIISCGFNIVSFFLWNNFEEESFLKDKKELYYTENITSILKIHILSDQKNLLIKNKYNADIGVVSALAEEMQPFLEKIENKSNFNINKHSLTIGTLTTTSGNLIRIVTAQQQSMGTVDASILGSILITNCNIKSLFMIGVCGGRDGIVKIGDILVPHDILAYQKGKITEKGLILDVETANSSFNESNNFSNKCDGIIQDIYQTYQTKLINKGEGLDVIKRPELHFDPMACGENVIDKPGSIDRIAKITGRSKICGLDMESYAIFRLNTAFDINTCVIKSVMDLAKNKNDKYKGYASFISANFLYEILKNEIYIPL